MSSSAEPFEFGTLEPLATLAGGSGDRTLEEMLDDLRAAAHAEGYEAGRQEALAAIQPAMQSLADALQVTGALRRTTVRDHLVLEVNPDDFELVRDAADGVAARIGGIRRMDVVAERR